MRCRCPTQWSADARSAVDAGRERERRLTLLDDHPGVEVVLTLDSAGVPGAGICAAITGCVPTAELRRERHRPDSTAGVDEPEVRVGVLAPVWSFDGEAV